MQSLEMAAPTLPNALRNAEVLQLLKSAVRCAPSAAGARSASPRITASQPRLIFLLDYDGTLSHIHPVPEKAVLTEQMRATLHELAQRHSTVVVTGRWGAVGRAMNTSTSPGGFNMVRKELHRQRPR